MDRINAMIAEINAEYAAMGVNVGVTHDASVVGIEGDEDEEEESDSDHEPRPTKRYVSLSRYAVCMQDNRHTLVLVSCHFFYFQHSDAESAPALLLSNMSTPTTGVAVSPPTTRTASLTRSSSDSVPSRTLLSERRRRRRRLIIEGKVRSFAQMLRLRRVSVIGIMKDIANRRSMLGT
jgi:hypothetical protein